MNNDTMFWQSYMNLEQAFLDLSKYVYITDVITHMQGGTLCEQSYSSQLKTFSPYIADLLIQCCVQIEAISKELYHGLGGAKPRGSSNLNFDEDALKEIDKKWSTHTRTVHVVCPSFHLTKKENTVLRPLNKAHKRGGTNWERSYQAVKHDRYVSLDKGNVKALLCAMAALYLLNVYHRNESWTVSFTGVGSIDMRLGSEIFAVKPPIQGQIWDGNEPIRSESPYIMRYTDEGYRNLCALKKDENDAFESYLLAQPEVHDPEFLARLDKASRTSGLLFLWELCRYRISKEVPSNLAFEERKERLLNSKEYQRFVQSRRWPVAAEITEKSIQSQIDEMGTWMATRIGEAFLQRGWMDMAMNQAICEVRLDDVTLDSADTSK